MNNKKQYIIITIIALFFCIGSFVLLLTKNNSQEAIKDSSSNTIEETETISIPNIDNYKGVIISQEEVFYNFEEITIDSTLIKTSLGKINSTFISNDENIYNLNNNSAYNVKKGKEIFSLNNDENIAVENDYPLGYSYYVKNIDEVKEKYKIEKRNNDSIAKFYLDAETLTFKEYKEYTFQEILGEKISDANIDDYLKYPTFLLSINESGYNYNYTVFKTTNNYVIFDLINNEAFILLIE